MTVLEQRFMERIPIVLTELVDELKKLNKNLENLNNNKNE